MFKSDKSWRYEISILNRQQNKNQSIAVLFFCIFLTLIKFLKPCPEHIQKYISYYNHKIKIHNKENEALLQIPDFLFILLQTNVVELWNFKLWILLDQIIQVWNIKNHWVAKIYGLENKRLWQSLYSFYHLVF